MKTGRHIAEVVGAVVLAAIAACIALVAVVGLVAALIWTALAIAVVLAGYRLVLSPWHSTWGATRAEADARLPGDELVPAGASTTRAIAIDAPPDAVWPWLVQIGFGRAGWYSYDRLDNDGVRSATEVIDRFQDLAVGDRIPMTPELGFVVRTIEPPATLVSLSDDASTSWVLHLDAVEGGACRLLSRFRSPRPSGLAGLIWAAIAGPGAFIMERRMLIGIRSRAEGRATGPAAGVDR